MSVRQIHNLLDLLERYAEAASPRSLAEIQTDHGWPRSSAHNILKTLATRGYLYEPGRRGAHYPTPLLLRLAERIAAGDPAVGALGERLQALAAETGETAILAGPGGGYAVYLDVAESEAPVRYAARVGTRLPLTDSASGRALLSLLPDRERERWLRLARFDGAGPNALPSADAVRVSLGEAEKRGWFESCNEHAEELAAVAVPFRRGGQPLALALGGPSGRIAPRMAALAARLRTEVEQLNDTA